MPLAALLALTILANGPATAAPASAPPADAPATITVGDNGDQDDVPANAPKDDYRFVAWCYGAMDESILIYQQIIPELKAIDARIGSPVKEAVPYAQDVAEERQALKRFAAAMEAAERASPRPITAQGVEAMQLGRSIWSQAKLQPDRQLAHAWLLWGSPDRCETTAKALKARATLLGQAMAIGAPTVDAPTPPANAASDAPAAAPADQGAASQTTTPAPPKAPATIDSFLNPGPTPPDPAGLRPSEK